ncbi:MAG: ABC transporter substrate-binding protein [Deltaproteobacteria bacterium]|nr:ABC transporter substrate-binding protein [Deltaproteobacteria bacterium]
MKLPGKALVLVTAIALFATASPAAEIRIGVAEALTGPVAKYGVPIRNGFALAAEEINAKGGIKGNKIELIIEDEQGKKEEAINVFKKFIFKDRTLAIFGPTLSNSAFAADPIANAQKTIVFGTSNTAEGITAIGPYVFRNSIAEADILPKVVGVAKKKLGLKKVAILYGNDDSFTKSGYDVFKRVVEQEKLQVLTTETFAKGDIDFSAQLTKIKNLNPDAIICSALVEEAANIILQARKLGMPERIRFIGGNGFNSAKLMEIAGKAAEGSISGSPWFLDDPSAKNQEFVRTYTAKFSIPPDQFAAQAYDALYIMAEGIKAAKLSGNLEKDRTALRNALAKVKNFKGVGGLFSFNENRDAAQKGRVLIIKKGKFSLYAE